MTRFFFIMMKRGYVDGMVIGFLTRIIGWSGPRVNGLWCGHRHDDLFTTVVSDCSKCGRGGRYYGSQCHNISLAL